MDTGVRNPIGAQVPTGTILPFAGKKTSFPVGFLWCNGAAYNQADYPALYAIIGDIYTSPPHATLFNVPDLRNRMFFGAQDDYTGIPKTNVLGVQEATGGSAATTVDGTSGNASADVVNVTGASGPEEVSENVHTHAIFIEDIPVLNPFQAGHFMIKT